MTSRENLTTPGVSITNDLSYMRGHGTFTSNKEIYSSLAGKVNLVGKLVGVKASRSRYTAEIGDVVVGRVLEVGNKRWRIDCNGRLDSVLLLASVHLPDGIQRRKNEADELHMRSFYTEGDILVAEVQTLYSEGSFGIHTRNSKYGRLRPGEVIKVQPSFIRRSRSHFVKFSCGVEAIIGVNGYIWVGSASSAVDQQTRLAISLICNCIKVLDLLSLPITEENISCLYDSITTFDSDSATDIASIMKKAHSISALSAQMS